jgi:hypothetical protein
MEPYLQENANTLGQDQNPGRTKGPGRVKQKPEGNAKKPKRLENPLR